ncbi:MAG TPA: hypothetical protein VMW72_21480 [Sedimentisphaerales bacterium]|nr:hypothetical protein [Sedimentisphaerales bacterium]
MLRKVMFDSSCVYGVVSPELEQGLAKQLPKMGRKCIYYTGPYLRMEFLRVWIVTGIKIYFRAYVEGDVASTFQYFSNKFGREAKIALHWATRYIKSRESDDITESVEQLGWEVVSLALIYDKIFRTYVQPKTGCTRGETPMNFETETRKDMLRNFYRRFMSPSHTCKIESLLNLQSGCPKLRKVRDADSSKLASERRKGFMKLQQQLETLIKKASVPTCDTCSKIGDLIIALEQPPKTVLYHTDHAFSVICPLLNHAHQQVKSALRLEPRIPKELAS